MMGLKRRQAEAVVGNEPVALLDGTPGTFANLFKAAIDLPVRRLMVVEARKAHDVSCVICDEPGGEFTILMSFDTVCEETEEPYIEEIVWAVHEKHFHTEAPEGEEGLHGAGS